MHFYVFSYAGSDLIYERTCGDIETALAWARSYKEKGLVCAGCLPARYFY